ncbi:unnamed protein product [Caenorhabditis bovis]|uniref:Uncharacterized protein n=1 Tax=Caenorhabditis bovis TaxID=2654633 RepID=A0A8S1FDG6_9PELO|nr:unnamed protein product [Caenorhabditis bovis]
MHEEDDSNSRYGIHAEYFENRHTLVSYNQLLSSLETVSNVLRSPNAEEFPLGANLRRELLSVLERVEDFYNDVDFVILNAQSKYDLVKAHQFGFHTLQCVVDEYLGREKRTPENTIDIDDFHSSIKGTIDMLKILPVANISRDVTTKNMRVLERIVLKIVDSYAYPTNNLAQQLTYLSNIKRHLAIMEFESRRKCIAFRNEIPQPTQNDGGMVPVGRLVENDTANRDMHELENDNLN